MMFSLRGIEVILRLIAFGRKKQHEEDGSREEWRGLKSLLA